jgi:hypothetical protein
LQKYIFPHPPVDKKLDSRLNPETNLNHGSRGSGMISHNFTKKGAIWVGLGILMALAMAGCGRRGSIPTQTAAGLTEQEEASLNGVYETSKAAEKAVIAGADKRTFKTLRTKFASELSKAESAATRVTAPSENQEILEHLQNYKTVLWAYEMYGEAWDFHDAYWTNCIKKGRNPDYCVDQFRAKGSELIAEAANVGISLFPFERDPLKTVWTMASRFQGAAEAQFLGQRSQPQQ